MNILAKIRQIIFKKKYKSYILAHADLAMADGKLDEAEYEYIVKLGKGFGVSNRKVDKLIQKPNSVVAIPSTKRKKIRLIYSLLYLAIIDGHSDSKEERIVKNIAAKIGLAKGLIDELIKSISENIRNGNDFEETLKRIRLLIK